MRKIIFVSVLVVIIGGILAAAYLVRPVSLTADEITQITNNCYDCHAAPLPPGLNLGGSQAHTIHREFDCTACHLGGEEDDVPRSVCDSCHASFDYTSANAMHDEHATTQCSACHTEEAGLVAVDQSHNVLKWIGIILAILVVAGLMLNMVVAAVRLSKKRRGQ